MRVEKMALLERVCDQAGDAPAEVFAGIFHDLRNVLTSLELSISGLNDGDERRQRIAARLRQHAALAGALSQEGAWLIGRERQARQPEWLMLRRLVESVCHPVASAHGCAIHVNIDAAATIYARRLPLERTLFNLLSNAAKADAGRIEIELAARQGRLVLSVRDAGGGLPEAMRDNPFAITASEAGGARLRLGLWLSRTLMREEGGDVELVATGETGTEFMITLPNMALCGLDRPAQTARA